MTAALFFPSITHSPPVSLGGLLFALSYYDTRLG